MPPFPPFFWIGEGIIAVFMIRNQFVARERRRVNNEMHRLGQEDINQGYQPFWRYDHYWAVSYAKMMFVPRRVRSFYRDSPALKPLNELEALPPPLLAATTPTRRYEFSSRAPSEAARERARELLDRHLTPEQREMVKEQYLQIKGKSGRRYCIHWDYELSQPRLFTLRRVGLRYGHHRSVCCSVGAYEHWPIADRVLALKLCLESEDEERVMKTAVKSSTDWVMHP